MNNTFYLPSELLVKIIEYSDSNTKKELSLVDRRTNALVSDTIRCNTVKCIRVSPPVSLQGDYSDIPEDILVRVISRYPRLTKIIFGPENLKGEGGFGAKEVPYLKSLISYLKSDQETHPLISVKEIQFREIAQDKLGSFDGAQAKELNNDFLSAIAHEGLENIEIRADGSNSVLTKFEARAVINNSPNLKKFKISGLYSGQKMSVTLINKLKNVKIYYSKPRKQCL